jgi:thioredoxin-related protein
VDKENLKLRQLPIYSLTDSTLIRFDKEKYVLIIYVSSECISCQEIVKGICNNAKFKKTCQVIFVSSEGRNEL